MISNKRFSLRTFQWKKIKKPEGLGTGEKGKIMNYEL